jgi:hypothetical protein
MIVTAELVGEMACRGLIWPAPLAGGSTADGMISRTGARERTKKEPQDHRAINVQLATVPGGQ